MYSECKKSVFEKWRHNFSCLMTHISIMPYQISPIFFWNVVHLMTFPTSTNLWHSDTGIIAKTVNTCDMSKIFNFTCISYGEYFLSLTGNDIVMRCELLLGYFCSISSEIWVCCSWDIRLSVEWPRNFNQRSGLW